ncbi:SAM-dependent methyltransferase [Janthinobacterium sp. BJB301]|uniref:class I SAM-dependent methyltransferase n=1 Tax=Janthinobacterium sp. BJB301 TaxID=1560195 RepID=UPI000C0DB9F3|nr:class I SAM-dependent methyltransferase [Janthinobacterium sp. BJB301]PHV49297.1 SAM-dependent methyltransferase [Janthinobacterium sp. BJB301]
MTMPLGNNFLRHNQQAWDAQAAQNSPWSQPVDSATIAAARAGQWQIHLTPGPLPAGWLDAVQGKRILCLAGAGGQQAPVLAAAGAQVTVFDLSEQQLAKDRMVAERDGLQLATVQGDMRDLACFADASFDVIVHPVSNQYVPDIAPVWRECARVLADGGVLLSSFFNPAVFIGDRDPQWTKQGLIRPRFVLPYSDVEDMPPDALAARMERGEALIFGHGLDSQIGGQLATGFVLAGYHEEMHPHPRFEIEKYLPSFIATRAVRQARAG